MFVSLTSPDSSVAEVTPQSKHLPSVELLPDCVVAATSSMTIDESVWSGPKLRPVCIPTLAHPSMPSCKPHYML